MNNIHLDETDLATQRDVITFCDYETCPTIKSNNEVNRIIAVKSNGNLHSLEAGSNHGDNSHYEPVENRAVGVLLS